MKKVIVQDTNYDLLETMTIILEEAEYEVLPVIHYQDVLAKITDFKPDIILLDFKLTGEESISVCRQIKTDFPQLPIVAMSCGMQIRYEYANAGFDDYITKPFDLDVFFKIIRRHTFPIN
jgi:DNA-binding response OmpR family regulator